MVSYIQGSVYLNNEQLPDPLVAQYPYIKDSESLRTEAGRAEVFMNPGLSVHLDANSSLSMISSSFEDTRVALTQGAAVATTPEIGKYSSFSLAIRDATVSIEKSGTYHFYAEPARVKVFSGLAKVQMGGKTIEIPGGKMLDLSGTTASLEKIDKNDTDALDRWSARRGELMAAANASSARNCNASGFVSSAKSNPCAGTWRWNPWFNLYTYIPQMNRWCDPLWGYCYYNPMAVMEIYQQPNYGYGNYGGGRPMVQQPAVNRPTTGVFGPGGVPRAAAAGPSSRPTAPPAAMSNSRGVSLGSPGVSRGVVGGGGGGGPAVSAPAASAPAVSAPAVSAPAASAPAGGGGARR